jgi:hypothetical protein
MDAGQVCLLDCPAKLPIIADEKGDRQEENLNNSWQLQAPPPVARTSRILPQIRSRIVVGHFVCEGSGHV